MTSPTSTAAMDDDNESRGVGILEADLNGQDMRIGIVQARFNEDHCVALTTACIEELIKLGVSQADIKLVTVPGALEIPFALQKLAETGEFDGLVALGAIIRGETYHFELVANESGAGVSRIALDYNVPIANAILTTENMEQAIARQTEKGRDAARVAVEMAMLLEDLSVGDDDLDDEAMA
jgi:6,7-dimethyl-8-ribityllumazine synthase